MKNFVKMKLDLEGETNTTKSTTSTEIILEEPEQKLN